MGSSFPIFDIILYAVLALSLVSGMHKGFMGSILALGGFVGAWFAALRTYGFLAEFALRSDMVTTFFRDALGALTESLFKAAPAFAGEAVATATDVGQKIESLGLPEMFRSAFSDNVVSKAYEGRLFGDQALVRMDEYLTQTILEKLVAVLSFVVAFAVIYFAALLIVNLLNNVFRFPSLKRLDWLLGGVIGALRGVVIISLIFAVIPTLLTVFENMNITFLDDLYRDSTLKDVFGVASQRITNIVSTGIKDFLVALKY